MLVVVGLIAGCGGGYGDSDPPDSKPAEPLAGTVWQLQEIKSADGTITEPAKGPPPTLTFEKGKTVTVFTGCNSGSGKAVIQGPDQAAEVEFGRIALTLRACVDPLPMKVEGLMVKALSRMDVIEVPEDGSGMKLTEGGTPLEFRFIAEM